MNVVVVHRREFERGEEVEHFHITPRFTAEQIQEELAPLERRLQDLERENEALRAFNSLRLGRAGPTISRPFLS